LFEQRRLKNFFQALKGCGPAACLRCKAESLCVPVLELPALDDLLIAPASKLSYCYLAIWTGIRIKAID